jgi:hypothetical protein
MIIKDMKNLKIGITLALKSNDESIWTNGIKQNVLMLAHLLKNSKNDYEVHILNGFDVDFSTKKPAYLDGLDIHYFKNKFMEMDLIIVMGATLGEAECKQFRESGDKKIVSYKCGNNYVITMEEILFKESKTGYEIEQEIDELWYIPQQDESNRGYYTTLHRTNALIVPFIWHPKFLHESMLDIQRGFEAGIYKKDPKYQVGKEKKIIGVMEPNINVIKFCLIPAMITEECYRGNIGKQRIEKLRLTNAEQLKTNKLFMSLIKTFDLFKDNKISAESRYQTGYVLTHYLDVLICHQVSNPLNYLYLDAAYMGYPVLHNAQLCRDLGYYYEGSDTKDGAKMLDYILTKHDKNTKEYDRKNHPVLQRYHADNEKLIATYDMLIENLWKGGNKGLVYNPKTNLYKK